MSKKPDTKDNDPALQGEGNYAAARRHRESTEKFIASHDVEGAARKAQPQSAKEQDELRRAEKTGRSQARK